MQPQESFIFSVLKPNDQLKTSDDTNNEGILTVEREVPRNTYVNEVQEQLTVDSLLVKDKNGVHGLFTEDDLRINRALMRFLNPSVPNPLMGDPEEPKITKDGKWNEPCKFCTKPAYFDQVWGRWHCSSKCKDSYQGV